MRTKQFELSNGDLANGESIEEMIKTLESLNKRAKELGAIDTSVDFYRGDYGYVEISATRYMTPEEVAKAEADDAVRNQRQLDFERRQYEALRAKFEKQ
jgi:hypothetical protein